MLPALSCTAAVNHTVLPSETPLSSAVFIFWNFQLVEPEVVTAIFVQPLGAVPPNVA